MSEPKDIRLKDATIVYRTKGDTTVKFYPISQLFFSPGVNNEPPRLVPSITKATIEEIESYYCPQCLENFPSSEAMQFRGRCPRGECFTCAECGSAAPPISASSLASSSCYFRCNFCRWNSLSTKISSETDGKLVALALSKEQTTEVEHVRTLNQRLQSSLHHQEKQAELHKRLSGRSTASVRSDILLSLAKLEYGTGLQKNGKWRPQDMDRVLALREAKQERRRTGQEEVEEVEEVVVEEKEEKEEKKKEEQKEKKNSSNTVKNSPLPLRCKLRTKRSLRCRKTFDQGHPGILLKSHINPLTGDSSMRAHMGKWYKKSSFARSSIPRLSVRRLIGGSRKGGTMTTTTSNMAVEMTLTNPTDVDLSVSFFVVGASDLVPLSESINGGTNFINERSSSVTFCQTANEREMERMFGTFMLERYDEIAEQDWSDEKSSGGGEGMDDDHPGIIDRVRNKVVVEIPLVCVNSIATTDSKLFVFSLGIKVTQKKTSEKDEEAEEEEEEKKKKKNVDKSGLNISYETQVILRVDE